VNAGRLAISMNITDGGSKDGGTSVKWSHKQDSFCDDNDDDNRTVAFTFKSGSQKIK
jgi:hypothetical protein